jgi:hypothetical protein
MFPRSRFLALFLPSVFQLAASGHAAPALPDHPRLLFSKAREQEVRDRAATDARLQRLIDLNHRAATGYLDEKPVHYHIPDGKRLLGQSRLCLQRVMSLAMAWRLSGDGRFLEGAMREMTAAAAFKDWNPSHFLDTAEMTTALAIGYDWLYHGLEAAQRQTLRKAMVQHGLEPGLACYRKGHWWVNGHNNWNQVCNAGMTFGALALWEVEPDLAPQIVDFACKSLPRGMQPYQPDGAYPEGPGYWNYGTTYNVLMIDALEGATGDTHGFLETTGFPNTGAYWLHAVGPSGKFFNYADGGEGYSPSPTILRLAAWFDKPEWAAWHYRQLDRHWQDIERRRGRFYPLEIVWYAAANAAAKWQDLPLDARFTGRQDLVMMRSAWDDPEALFVGVKGGDNATNHGHLDIGAFVIDALGVRWAVDLGADNYNLPGYFGGKRWTYYRMTNHSHNTLVIANQLQDTRAVAKIKDFVAHPERPWARIDMRAAYAKQAEKVQRGVAMVNRRAVLIQDEWTKAGDEVRWGMVTRAEIDLQGATALLRQDGKALRARILAPAGATFATESTAPPTDRENPNKGTRILAIRVAPQPVEHQILAVLLHPEQEPPVKTPEVVPLANWK